MEAMVALQVMVVLLMVVTEDLVVLVVMAGLLVMAVMEVLQTVEIALVLPMLAARGRPTVDRVLIQQEVQEVRLTEAAVEKVEAVALPEVALVVKEAVHFQLVIV